MARSLTRARASHFAAAVAFASISSGACGGSSQKQSDPVPPPSAIQTSSPAAQPPQQAARTLANTVDVAQLVALLPEVNGWTRGKPKAEHVTTGVTMSHAKAEYEKGDAAIDLDIIDSLFNQLVLSPFAIFLAPGYSERSGDGYARSAPIGGYPGFEKWNNDSRRGEVTVVVANRFIVQATGRNVDDIDPVRTIVRAVDLRRIAALK